MWLLMLVPLASILAGTWLILEQLGASCRGLLRTSSLTSLKMELPTPRIDSDQTS